MQWLLVLIAVFIATWLLLVGSLVVAQRNTADSSGWREAVRLVPDALRLVRRLATDRSIPRLTRLPVWVLLGYLLSPIDIVPDFIPVIGYADDVILVALVLRGLVRRVGSGKIEQQWPGTPEGLVAFRRLLRLPVAPD